VFDECGSLDTITIPKDLKYSQDTFPHHTKINKK